MCVHMCGVHVCECACMFVCACACMCECTCVSTHLSFSIHDSLIMDRTNSLHLAL